MKIFFGESSVYFQTIDIFVVDSICEKFGFPNLTPNKDMRVLGRNKLIKLKKKNKGNRLLCAEIDQLLADLEGFDSTGSKLTDIRKDADCVHSDGFYFFNINIHRCLVLVDIDEDGEATVIWAGSHDEYERTFKNNKSTIEKWLRKNEYVA
jgi:hypothetical protein